MQAGCAYRPPDPASPDSPRAGRDGATSSARRRCRSGPTSGSARRTPTISTTRSKGSRPRREERRYRPRDRVRQARLSEFTFEYGQLHLRPCLASGLVARRTRSLADSLAQRLRFGHVLLTDPLACGRSGHRIKCESDRARTWLVRSRRWRSDTLSAPWTETPPLNFRSQLIETSGALCGRGAVRPVAVQVVPVLVRPKARPLRQHSFELVGVGPVVAAAAHDRSWQARALHERT